MYLEKAIFDNRAPFEHIEINFNDKGVNVLTAINGKGKTTILSHIADAFYELAKPFFPQEFENKEGKLYRISSQKYNIDLNKSSFVYFRFRNDDQIYDYIDVCGDCQQDQYNQAINIDNKIEYNSFQTRLKNDNFVKIWQNQDNKKIKDLFQQNVLTFFPSYRFELPVYLNEPYSKPIEYTLKDRFNGYLPNPIEVVSDVSSFANWLLDIILDMKLNERLKLNSNSFPTIIFSKENLVLNNVNNILSQALSSKKYNGDIRFGIGKRNGGSTRIAIMNDIGKDHLLICPSIFQLSSGELAIISIFGEILRQADNNQNNISLDQIKGIVLIDEIDKHLHITLQKEILPKMFALFPNVQFITSSHSPFLNMGLAEQIPNNHKIYDLDHNGISCIATQNEQYEEVYQMMVGENERYADLYNTLKKQLGSATKPLVITEGKTDIKHILNAKEKLGITDLDFDIIQREQQPEGDSNLQKLLDQVSHIKNPHKIIGIFDRDIKGTVKLIEENDQAFKNYGNNVFAFCIMSPQRRKDQGQNEISIEYLYSDEEIHKEVDDEGRHLFFGKEFNDASRNVNDPDLVLSMPHGRTMDKILESLNGQKVTNRDGKNLLSTKECFAEAIAQGKIKISSESWENFKPIFEKIRQILALN